MQFDIEGEGGIERALEKARKQFPYSAEKALRKESAQIKKQIVNSYVGSTIKSKRKNWKRSWQKKKNTALEKSFAPGKVIRQGGKYTTAVVSKAPHYHLVEDGHKESGWYAKQDDAKPIKGQKIVAKIMARRSEKSDKYAQELLDEILKDAGLL